MARLLHEAALRGEVECARILIDAKANLEIKNNDGHTPLYLATQGGFKDIVKLLLEAGADPKSAE